LIYIQKPKKNQHFLGQYKKDKKILGKFLYCYAIIFCMEHYEHVITSIVAMVVALGVVLAAGKPKIMPSKLQFVIESYINFCKAMVTENIGEQGLRYLPLIASIGLFVFFGNVMELLPFVDAPTGNINTTLALTLIVFFLYHFEGFRVNGLGYIKHFMGPIKALAPFFFIIEIMSHLGRVISLSLRLFANMKGGAILLISIIGVLIGNPFTLAVSPIVLVFLITIKVLAIVLQTFIFMILSTIYIAGAVAHEEY